VSTGAWLLGILQEFWQFVVVLIVIVAGPLLAAYVYKKTKPANGSRGPAQAHSRSAIKAPSGQQDEPETANVSLPTKFTINTSNEFKECFGVLWKVKRIPTIGHPTLYRTQVTGPYCPNCREEYQLKNILGVRHLMDDDVIGGLAGISGRLFCGRCVNECLIDERYLGARKISTYKEHIRSRFE
jgi:hypothetical protein